MGQSFHLENRTWDFPRPGFSSVYPVIIQVVPVISFGLWVENAELNSRGEFFVHQLINNLGRAFMIRHGLTH